MKSFVAAFLCFLAYHSALQPALAAEDDSAAALLKERMEIHAKVQEINQEGSNATALLQTKRNLMSGILMSAKGPPPTAAQLEQWKSSAEMYRLQLAAVQRQLELAQITAPTIRAEKIKQLEAASAKIDREFQEADAPTQKKIEALKAPLRKTDPAFAAALDKFFKDGSGTFAAAKHGKTIWLDNDTGQIHWSGADRKDLAWCAIFLQDRENGNFPGAKIEGMCRLVGSSSGTNNPNIWISAGHFNLNINVSNKPDWGRDEATLIELAKNLVDLKGLEALGREQK